MKISPVINYSYRNNPPLKTQKPSFGSILADINADNQDIYAIYTMQYPQFAQIRLNATRIFRELPSEMAIAKMMKPDDKTQINILGCSDGSEVYAYAIALKEELGEKASKNIKIKGVDLDNSMIELAKSGKIICSDAEKIYTNGGCSKTKNSSPLKGEGWNKYLTKTTRPEVFKNLSERNSCLKFMEYDPISRKKIGDGLDWYKVNQDGLPEIEFITGNMTKHTQATDNTDCEVYVIANSGGYVLQRNPDEYIKMFKDIKEANKDKDKRVFVVVGDVEVTTLESPMGNRFGISNAIQNKVKKAISSLGFEKVPDFYLRKKGVENYKDASKKIYLLED